MSPDREQARQALAEAGTAYKDHLDATASLLERVKAAAVEADDAGVPRIEIIHLSRLSRSAAYDLFRNTRGVKSSD